MSDTSETFFKNRTMVFLKTEEEKAKEAEKLIELQLKIKEIEKEQKAKLEKLIFDHKKDTLVKYVLKIINEGIENQNENIKSEIQITEIYKDKAKKIAKYIEKKEPSRFMTSAKLFYLGERISHLAYLIDKKTDSFPEENEPLEYENIRKGIGRFPFPISLPSLLGEKPVSPPTRKIPQYPESDRLRKLSKQLSIVSNEYYNTHLIVENPRFIADDDPNVTPSNFFSRKRIIEFVRTLPNDQMKYRYLQQMDYAYIDKDRRGFIYKNGQMVCAGSDLFLQQMRKEISLYVQTTQKEIFESPMLNKLTLKNKDENESLESQSLRQKILTLMILTFGRLDLPEDITQEKVVKFFHNLTGGDIKKVRQWVKKPTAYKEDNKQSRRRLCNDLNSVRDSLGKLGLNDKVQSVVNEIQFLIDELERNNEFD